MSTPSSKNGGESPAPETARRDLRDRWEFRIAALVVVLLFALVISHGCASEGRDLSADEAVAKAEEKAGWVPDKYQVRFLQQGIPPQPYWGVSLYNTGPRGRPTKVEVYLVNATTGEVTRQG